MKNIRRGIRLFGLLWIGFILSGFMTISYGQVDADKGGITKSLQGGGDAGQSEKNLTIRAEVEEVRIDAVVVDGKRRVVPDMAANDFEIYQDGKRQEITSCSFVDNQPSRPGSPTTVPTWEGVGRTIAFVLDDNAMSKEQIHFAAESMQKFVETQMQTGDLVAIFRSSSDQARNMIFTPDRQLLQAVIEDLRSRSFNCKYDTRIPRPVFLKHPIPAFPPMLYYIQAMKDLPGRKHLLWITNRPFLVSPETEPNSIIREIQKSWDRLADAALRAGVVIHTLDAEGLEVGTRVDRTHYIYKGNRKIALPPLPINPFSTPIPLAEKTGGISLQDSNWFLKGIGDADEYMKGYYILTYTPPQGTFKSEGEEVYHRIKIKSKRRGTEVHSRDGFFGKPEDADDPAVSEDPLVKAMFSPFRYNSLPVDLSAGWLQNIDKSYMVHAWVHLDGRQLGIKDDEGGGQFVSVEAFTAITDVNNLIHSSGKTPRRIHVNKEDIQSLHEHGLRFSVAVPVCNPGRYYVRLALKDVNSGKIGSAYQYVEIPDLKDGRLALSDLFIVNGLEDARWILDGTAGEYRLGSDLKQREKVKSPASRKYRPGDNIEYMAVIYNATIKKESLPDLETNVMLYRDGSEVFKSKPEAVNLDGGDDYKSIPVKKLFSLDKTIQPGYYVLQLQVKDKRTKGEDGVVSKAFDFEVIR